MLRSAHGDESLVCVVQVVNGGTWHDVQLPCTVEVNSAEPQHIHNKCQQINENTVFDGCLGAFTRAARTRSLLVAQTLSGYACLR